MTVTPVYFRAQYLTIPVEQMRKEDWDATHLVKAVKGLELNPSAYSMVEIDNRSVTIRDANKDRAIEWFAQWAAKRVAALGTQDQKVLVPIPPSSVTVESPSTFRTSVIASEIAKRCTTYTTVAPLIRWRRPMANTRDGGTRNPERIYKNCVVVSDIPPGDCVIIDDVFTTGGHLKAVVWRLDELDLPVVGAICCGRTCQEQLDNPFDVPVEAIQVYSPNV